MMKDWRWLQRVLRRGWSGFGRPAAAGLARVDRHASMREAWRRSRPGLVIVVLLTFFINLLKLTIPLYIFQLLDRVISSRSLDTLVLLSAITVFAVIVGTLAEVTRRWMLVHWGSWIEQHFGKLLFLRSLDSARARAPSKALEELSDVSQFVAGSGASAWLDVMWAPAFLFLVYLIHPTLALIVLAGMLAMLALGIMNEIVTRPLRAALRKARRQSESLEATAERQLDAVAGLNISPQLAERWHESVTRRAGESLSNRMVSLSMNETMRFVQDFQRVACYGIGVWLVVADAMTAGGVIAAAVLGRMGTSAVRRAMANLRQLMLTVRSYKRVSRRLASIRHTAPAIRDPDAALELHLDQITHTHNAWSRPVFRKLDLKVAPGELLCIIGPSGSGKSTLARLIAGVAAPTMGAVRLGEVDITRYSSQERQNVLGYLQQDTPMLKGTIAENISSLRTADDRAIVEAAKLAGIHEIIVGLPDAYETQIGAQRNPLAGGEVRRLGVARALFGRPRLIVLDEPEANLDERLVRGLLRSLDEARNWGSVVVVTSQMRRLASISDKIILLDLKAEAQIFNSCDAFDVHRAQNPAETTLRARLSRGRDERKDAP